MNKIKNFFYPPHDESNQTAWADVVGARLALALIVLYIIGLVAYKIIVG